MRKLLLLAGTTTALLAAGASPALALGAPERPKGSVVTGLTSDNGGDNGWGNCGHNASGGQARTGLGAAGEGNGGYKPWDTCPTPTPSTDPTTVPTTSTNTTISFS
jgi:hypothetical protein